MAADRSLRASATALDLAVYKRIRGLAGASDGDLTRVVRRYSRLGEHGAVWIAGGMLGALLDHRRRRDWARASVCVGAAYCTSTTIKMAVARKRPAVEDVPHLMATPTGLSFPSSHSSSSFAAVQAFGGLVPRGPLRVAAIAMGLSRLYLGVHYPSDVAAGAVLGTILGRFGR